MKLVYPACFYPEENGQYSVIFPDLGDATTFGNNLEEAIEMAIDLASGWLLTSVEDNEELPKASNVKDVVLEGENAFVSLIAVDLTEYERLRGNKAVKKTLTIPAWMNTLAEKKGINFSAMLQNTLRKELKPKMNKDKLLDILIDSIQIFYDNQKLYDDEHKREQLKRALDKDGNSLTQMFSFVKDSKVSEWYKEAKHSIDICIRDDIKIETPEKLCLCLQMVDLIAGFSLYNVIVGANAIKGGSDIDFKEFLNKDI